MRQFFSVLVIGFALIFVSAPASAQYRTGGGYHHQNGGPNSDYIADCIDRLPAWGYKNPCARHHGRQAGVRHGSHGARNRTTMTNRSGGRTHRSVAVSRRQVVEHVGTFYRKRPVDMVRTVSRRASETDNSRGWTPTYHRSTTGGCTAGFRLVRATGECI